MSDTSDPLEILDAIDRERVLRDANGIAAKACDEALEEAAQLCQTRFKKPMDVEALNCARAIRALKDKQQP